MYVLTGIEVQYAANIAGIPPGPAVLRVLIILWTGDYPAQCEVGKFINKGVHPCRRCKLEGTGEYKIMLHACLTLINFCVLFSSGELYPGATHYYYGDCISQIQDPFPPRVLSQSLVEMKLVDVEERVSNRTTLAKECGFTGLSILHGLHSLYGFDVIRDMVFDAMHNIALNVTIPKGD